jgi:6-pyruvoyltetrahydropterin/6-carboxytetrahydropterin synthase
VSKEFQWAMAHMLDGHEGLCQNLHGHEYKLIVTVTSKDADINDK